MHWRSLLLCNCDLLVHESLDALLGCLFEWFVAEISVVDAAVRGKFAVHLHYLVAQLLFQCFGFDACALGCCPVYDYQGYDGVLAAYCE